MKLYMRRRARSLLLQALYQWNINRESVAVLLENFLAVINPKKVDLPFFKEELEGIIQNQPFLDQLFSVFLDRPLQQLDLVELSILRIGAYEIVLTVVPYKVAINEALELAKKFGSMDSYRFVNGILDKVAKHNGNVE